MKVEDIIGKLKKAGFAEPRSANIANITCEGGWLVGKYLGPSTWKDEEGEERINQKFAITEGEALMGKDAEKVEKIPEGEYTVFGSGLLNWILANQHKVGDVVAVVYKGKGSFKRGNKTVKSHNFEVMSK